MTVTGTNQFVGHSGALAVTALTVSSVVPVLCRLRWSVSVSLWSRHLLHFLLGSPLGRLSCPFERCREVSSRTPTVFNGHVGLSVESRRVRGGENCRIGGTELRVSLFPSSVNESLSQGSPVPSLHCSSSSEMLVSCLGFILGFTRVRADSEKWRGTSEKVGTEKECTRFTTHSKFLRETVGGGSGFGFELIFGVSYFLRVE